MQIHSLDRAKMLLKLLLDPPVGGRAELAAGRSFLSRMRGNETYNICFVPSRLAVISKIPVLEGNVALSHISEFSLFSEILSCASILIARRVSFVLESCRFMHWIVRKCF